MCVGSRDSSPRLNYVRTVANATYRVISNGNQRRSAPGIILSFLGWHANVSFLTDFNTWRWINNARARRTRSGSMGSTDGVIARVERSPINDSLLPRWREVCHSWRSRYGVRAIFENIKSATSRILIRRLSRKFIQFRPRRRSANRSRRDPRAR